ncbi:cystathionine gamma-synthase [Haematomicrobium sanguinis]|uniref:cystathionine gamma-synthase n=1 Tax=Haematomicrobium sanguinis TaxID=479106 RepID=UPI000B118FC3|nr:cystathionine gamma-synthase [Haematomicrobium sanguinis]
MSESQAPNVSADGFNTRAIHAGQTPDPVTGAVIPPIYQTSTFAQDGIGQLRSGYEYARGGNPSRDSLQEQLAALEGAQFAYSFGSGLAAEDALIRAALKPGDTVLMGNDVYGGTYRLFARVLEPWGIKADVMDMSDIDALAARVAADKPTMLWVETPSNPLMKITDIAAVAEIAARAGATLVVDNTFATPYLQNPLALGANAVVHSTTKYLGGHSDVVGGAVVTSDADLAERVKFVQFAVGAVSGPMDAWLTTRGIKTLGVRMDRHSASGQRVAEYLRERPEVSAVYYPGLDSHPGHEVAARQMRGFGGMVSVQFAGGAQVARAVAESTRLFTLAESLGGVESLMNYPSEMTHASVKGTELAVPDDLLRLSVGLEDVDDLLADLEQAIERA